MGPHLAAPFREIFQLKTFDLPGRGADFEGDLASIEPLQNAMRGCEVVVHLAATSDEAPFVEQLVPNNVTGVFHVLEAARLEKVRRVVFASSIQTVGFRSKDGATQIEAAEMSRPNSLYGATKVMGETMGRWFHDKYGLEFIALRVGAFQPYDSSWLRENRCESIWLSPRDAAQIFRRAIETPDLGFAVVNATSRTSKEFLSLQSAREILGYDPQDDTRDFFQSFQK